MGAALKAKEKRASERANKKKVKKEVNKDPDEQVDEPPSEPESDSDSDTFHLCKECEDQVGSDRATNNCGKKSKTPKKAPETVEEASARHSDLPVQESKEN